MKRLRRGAATLGIVGLLLGQAGCVTFWGPADSGATEPAPPPVQVNKDELAPQEALPLVLSYADSLDRSDDVANAIQQYEHVLRLDPKNHRAARRLAVLYDRFGAYDKAEAQYRKLATELPRDADFFNDWGRSYYERGNFKEADNKLRRALELKPNDSRILCNLALAQCELGRYADAYQSFRKAQLSEAEAHTNLALIFWRHGKLAEARESCQRALQAEQGFAQAQEILVQLDSPTRPPAPDRRLAGRPVRRPEAAHPQYPPPLPDGPVGPRTGQAAPSPGPLPPPVLHTSNGLNWIPVAPAPQQPAPQPPAPPAEEVFR